jgi:hypothetical protein
VLSLGVQRWNSLLPFAVEDLNRTEASDREK